jgi:cellulose synthase (UDP-forming)
VTGLTKTARDVHPPPSGRRTRASPVALHMDVSDKEKYGYFGPQHRWYLVARFLAFIGLLVSLIRFSYADARISGLLLIVVLLLVVSLVSLYTSTRPRRMDEAQHRDLVQTFRSGAGESSPSVDVFLPTAGESLTVLETTYSHVEAMNYPGRVEVYVLDDSDRAEVAALAAAYHFRYLSRPDRGYMKKAGNLAYGYVHSAGDLIAVFDADFAPRPDYLLELVPYLQDPGVGIAQSPQFFNTRDGTSWLQQAAGATQELFYRWVQPSRDAIGAPICVGTCAVYRRAALIEAGGFAQIQHSEDVHTGVKVMAAGYTVRYVPIVLAKGLCPNTLTAFIDQQYRWCAGSMSLLSSTKFWNLEMPFRQRLSYVSGFCYYAHTALFTFAGPLIPIIMLIFFPQFVRLEHYLLIVPSVVYNFVVFPLWHKTRYRMETWTVKILYGWAHAFAIWDLLRGQAMGWQPTGGTAKKSRTRRLWLGLGLWSLGTALVWTLAAATRMSSLSAATFTPAFLAGVVYLTTVLQALLVNPVNDVRRKRSL